MEFYPTDDLKSGELMLRLKRTCGEQPEKRWLPAYYFSICLPDGTEIGYCDLRIGHNEKTYIGGNIGYGIDAPFRGCRYAAKACALLFKQARKHGMEYVIITCDPANIASARTCELAGGRYLETAPIPEDNEMYAEGKRQVMVWRFDLKAPDTLEGEHIRLRKAEEKDWASMLENVWGDEAVYRWMLYQPTLTEEDARERCRRSIAYQKEHTAWFVALRDTDEAIGLCALREEEAGHVEESGICIGRRYQGRGYGKEIVSLLLDIAFRNLGAQDLRYGYFQDNERSKKLADQFGFRYDRTYELARSWDGAVKTIDSCLLTREEYLRMLAQSEKRADSTQGK